MKTRSTAGSLPAGWLATGLGGVVGAGGGFFLGIGMAEWMETVDPGEGFEGLGRLILGAAIGIFLGAAVGAAASLKLFRHQRAVASGLIFATLASLAIVVIGGLGALVIPWNLGEVGAALSAVVSVVVAAWSSRKLCA
jgi:hypothetical protein